jgi:hypothetical protein
MMAHRHPPAFSDEGSLILNENTLFVEPGGGVGARLLDGLPSQLVAAHADNLPEVAVAEQVEIIQALHIAAGLAVPATTKVPKKQELQALGRRLGLDLKPSYKKDDQIAILLHFHKCRESLKGSRWQLTGTGRLAVPSVRAAVEGAAAEVSVTTGHEGANATVDATNACLCGGDISVSAIVIVIDRDRDLNLFIFLFLFLTNVIRLGRLLHGSIAIDAQGAGVCQWLQMWRSNGCLLKARAGC